MKDRRRWVIGIAAGFVLSCAADAHIRLFEPAEASPPPKMDAGRSEPPREPDPPRFDAGSRPRDSGQPPSRPDREPPLHDAGQPPITIPDTGTPPFGPTADSLVLRYDFSGDGDVVRDLIGDADARLIGGAMLSPDRGFVQLDGMDDYVDMPNGVISGLSNATILAWIAWDGGVCWQRVFDFGISDAGEDKVGNVVTSLFMTPYACGGGLTAMAELGRVQHVVSDDERLPAGYTMQVALVVDADQQTFTLYRDDARVGEAKVNFQLGELTDVNNWLGRSQWVQDAFFSGIIGEFRIYARVLTAEEIAALYAGGPNAP